MLSKFSYMQVCPMITHSWRELGLAPKLSACARLCCVRFGYGMERSVAEQYVRPVPNSHAGGEMIARIRHNGWCRRWCPILER